jgi:hypothetical protein
MAEDGVHVAAEQRQHQPSAPERVPRGQEQYVAQPLPSYAPSVLGDPRLSGRGNGPVRAAVVQRLQRTAGNRATARLIQRLTLGHPLVAVQRDDDDEEEQANDQSNAQANVPDNVQPNAQANVLALPQQGRVRSAHQGGDNQANNQANNANNNALNFGADDDEDIWAGLGDKKDDDEESQAHPLDDDEANQANQPVAELELRVDVDTADLGVLNVALGEVGHTWLSLAWLGKKSAVPNKISNPTRDQLKAQGRTSMGFWPLTFRPEDWTDEANQIREERKQKFPFASPGRGASGNKKHEGFSLLPKKEVEGRVEQPDVSSHSAKAAYKYLLTEENLANLANYADANRRSKYSLAGFNCTTFAVEATRAAGQAPPSGVGKKGYVYPNALYTQIAKLLEDKNAPNGYDAKKGYLAK